jgi:hypothetical protein
MEKNQVFMNLAILLSTTGAGLLKQTVEIAPATYSPAPGISRNLP